MSNKNVYKKKRIVEIYSKQTELQKPEKTIFNLLKNDLPKMKMLDVGVGGGRTTLHLAKLVDEYIGIDSSEEMIEVCRKRFADYPEKVSFRLCDVRNLAEFGDNQFDFILFSFNGIDYISHAERLKVLEDFRRILKPKGYFCFSSHNLQSIHKLFDFKEQKIFQIGFPKQIIRWALLRFIYNNKVPIRKLKDKGFAIFNDGAERFGLQSYYIKPSEQIKQLQPYFSNVQIFFLKNGNQVVNFNNLKSIKDDWLYYLCS